MSNPQPLEIAAAALVTAAVLQLVWLSGYLLAQKRFRHLATVFLCVALMGLALRMGKSSLNAFIELSPAVRNLGLAGMLAVPPALAGHWVAVRRQALSSAALAGLAVAVAFGAAAAWIPNSAGDPVAHWVYVGILGWGFGWGAWGWSRAGLETAEGRWVRAGALALLAIWMAFLLVFVSGSTTVYVAWCAVFAALCTGLAGAWLVHPALPAAYARLLRRGADPDDLERAHALLARLETEEAFRDPDLTLSRFARRAGLPDKQVSRLMALIAPHHFPMHCGYNSSAAFSRAFKAETGVAPSSWRPAAQTRA